MKLSIRQRVLLALYKYKINAVALVSTQKATEQLFNFFCTPHLGKLKFKKPAIFSKAQHTQILYNNKKINGWSFLPQNFNGKTILVLHGFNSCAYKSVAIIESLLKNNYAVVAYDAMAHGTSEGSILNAKIYVGCVEKILHQHSNINSIIGHSLGGLTASLITEKYNTILEKLVLIAPATETITVFHQFFEVTKFSKKMLPLLENYVLQYSGKPVSYYSVSRAITNITIPILWIHDKNDIICPINDVLVVKQKNYSQVSFIITEKLGHNAIYRKPQVLEKIIEFLNK